MIDPVRRAAEATLASGTARIRHRSFAHPPHASASRWDFTEEGLADFARRRIRVEQSRPEGFDELTRRILGRYPWLAGDDEDDGTAAPAILVHAGSAAYACFDERWMVMARGEPDAPYRLRADPVWIVDVLRRARTTHDRGETRWRETACHQWTFEVPPDPLPEPPGARSRQRGRLAGEAYVDGAGRLRAVTWTSLSRRRSRLPGAAERGVTVWRSLELWDCGTPVEIELPPVTSDAHPAPPLALFQAWRALRLRKRDYERRGRRS